MPRSLSAPGYSQGFNGPLPVGFGGTGSNTPSGALENLGGVSKSQILDPATGKIKQEAIVGGGVGGGGSGGDSWTYVPITTNTTLTPFAIGHVKTAGLTVKLPASPVVNTRVRIVVDDFTNTNLDGNGSSILGVSGELFEIDTANQVIELGYFDTWRIVSTSIIGAVAIGSGGTGGTGGVSGDTVGVKGYYKYDERHLVRSLQGSKGELVLIEGLGFFVWDATTSEPDDDESCFATTSGKWILSIPALELLEAWDQAEKDLSTDIIHATVPNPITNLGAASRVSFNMEVLGAVPGDKVLAAPPNMLGPYLSYYGYVSSQNNVTIVLQNSHDSNGASLPVGEWSVVVFKTPV